MIKFVYIDKQNCPTWRKNNILLQNTLHSLSSFGQRSFFQVSSVKVQISKTQYMRHWCGNKERIAKINKMMIAIKKSNQFPTSNRSLMRNTRLQSVRGDEGVSARQCSFRTETCQGCQSRDGRELFLLKFFQLDCTSAFSAFGSKVQTLNLTRNK